MRRLLRQLGAVAAALAAATALAAPAHAHGGEDGLVVEPAATTAGGTVTVRGDLPTTSTIQLLLVASGKTLTLARVQDPPQGHFEVVVAMPASAAPGTWRLEARVGSTLLAQSAVRVSAGSSEAGPGEQADQAEPVASPPGTGLVAIRPDAASLAARPVDDASTRSPWWWAALVAGSAGGLGSAAGAWAALARRRRARPAEAQLPVA